MQQGRPTTYTEEIAETICNRLVEGESLNAICKDEAMPCRKTVYNWFNDHPGFLHKYAQSREIQFEFLADDIIEQARSAMSCEDSVKVQGINVYVNTLKWALSKVLAKKYGDKQEIDLTVHEFNIKMTEEDDDN